ncbi:MAG: hypothetical protein LC795_15460 [Acidobacteria bacterium]|nr:hypothetical protein [Acidobacteriota bacterium]MCA1620673.1 hypothetical protein [Acidobacteriota bacterium]
MKFFTLPFVLLLLCVTAHAQATTDKPTRSIGRPGCNPGVPTRLAKEGTSEGPEFGDMSEIADCRTVYVGVTDLKVRAKILKELEKDPRLIVVGNSDDADFFIEFGMESRHASTTVTRNPALGPMITNNSTLVGRMTVTVRGRIDDQDRRHKRFIWQHDSSINYHNGTRGMGKEPPVAVTREFLKQLENARGGKK